MTSTITDRVYGESSGVAVKAPCVAVSTGPLPLVGLGAVGGYTPLAGDRILVKDNIDPTTNGIYNASTGAWRRSGDFDSLYDCVQGTLIVVYYPNANGTIYQLTTLNPVIGTTALNFSSFLNPNQFIPQTPAEAAAGVTPVNYFYPSGNILRYGADPTGVASSSTAIANAIKVMGSINGQVIFPPGIYLCPSSITYTLPSATASLSLLGLGGAEGAQLKFTTSGGSGITINYVGPFNSVHVRDLCFTSTNAIGVGNGLALIQTAASIANPANTAQSEITNCVFRGADGYALSQYWGACISVQSVSNVNFTNVTCVSNGASNGIGVALVSAAATIGVIYDFSGCIFNYVIYGIQYGSYIQGVSVIDCNFIGGQYGILCPTGAIACTQLLVSGSQFECSNNGILLQNPVTDTQITDCLIFVGLAANGVGIDMLVSGLYTISGNVFNPVGTPTNASGILIAGSGPTVPQGVIAGNVFDGMTGNGINLTNTSTNVNVQGNSFVACPIPISNLGANNTIANNPGYNPVGTGTGTVGASPATITNGASPATYYFAQAATFTATVSVGGVVVGTMTSATAVIAINLGPNESCVVSWTTTAPTYTRSVH